jgi:hypothetical protein
VVVQEDVDATAERDGEVVEGLAAIRRRNDHASPRIRNEPACRAGTAQCFAIVTKIFRVTPRRE